jgi:osmoprotectant transport system permease protein
MSEQLALLPVYATAHLQLTLLALLLGVTVSVPLGVWVTRRPGIEASVLGAASVLQTIPSLALLALMVPVLAALAVMLERLFGVSVSSIGFLPALIALTLYSLLPVLRNTVTGIAGVDPTLVEAARGVGMTDSQRLLRVELPLALPVIVAGVRTATVWVVGTATLATPVGATSLGNYIFSGLQTRNFTAVLVGSAASAGLAILLDGLIRLLESGVRDRKRSSVRVAGAILVGLYLYAAASAAPAIFERDEPPVAIGAKTFTEQYILAALLAGQVEALTGHPTRAVQSLGSTVVFDALRSGELDVYVDYSGTIWATIMKRDGLPEDRAEVLREVGAYLEAEHGIVMLGSLGFENTYALAMRSAQAEQLGIEAISDLAGHAPRLELGADYEFLARPEWQALEKTYGLRFKSERSMDSALMYEAVASGAVDVISAFSTDGRIAALDLRVLVDDRGVVPPYDAIVLVGSTLSQQRPEVLEALRALIGTIDATRMQQLNFAVDSEGRTPAAVAEEFRRSLHESTSAGVQR